MRKYITTYKRRTQIVVQMGCHPVTKCFIPDFCRTFYSVFRPIFFLLFMVACSSQPHNRQEVEAAMQHYDRLIQKMDGDSIALLFTSDGDLGDLAHGRDSIRRFLAGFKNVKVLEISSTSDSIILNKDTAFQGGHYHQHGVMNGKDTFNVKGSYLAQWIWVDGQGWRIKKMRTRWED